MIAGEKISIAIKQNHVAAGVTRSGYHEQIIIKADRIFSFNSSLDADLSCAIVGMHDSVATKLLSEQFVVSYVVAMG